MMRRFQVVLLAALVALGATEDATCDANGSCALKASALLQKGFQRDEKSTSAQGQYPLSSEDNLYNTVCTGIQAQGRCWYLSEMGESCAKTCADQGRSFSFVIADENDPITPRLVGHPPKVKQAPWAALECYVPSEDRFHTANQNSARHYVSSVDDWSHENCKLACPCGGAADKKCEWQQSPQCAPEFLFKGVKYSGCATVDPDHDRPWCQHSFQPSQTDIEGRDWSYCSNSCEGERPYTPPKKECGWIPAASCVREFDYEGTHFVGCTESDHDTPWCSNTDPYKGSWNHCTYSCPDEDRRPSNEELCTWQQSSKCSQTFTYKGVEYTGCIEQDHPTPWCSLDRVHDGAWEICTKVCTRPEIPYRPAPAPIRDPIPEPRPYPVPQTPTYSACDRHPDTENDIIGNGVTLDEAGYKIVAAADSTVNMKRFVCRVVANIGCSVTDEPALMSFLPYYSGTKRQTYKRLESEVTSLCRAGGRWLSPLPLRNP